MTALLENQEQSQRQRRVAMIIQRALSTILLNEDYPFTIHQVLLTKDLRIAKVYLYPQYQGATQKSITDEDREKVKHLQKNQARIKKKLVGQVYLKYMPALRFHLDENFTFAQKLNELSL